MKLFKPNPVLDQNAINNILSGCYSALVEQSDGNPTEPCYVAMLVKEFTKQIRDICCDAGIRVGSCFVHQRPKVKFEDGQECCEAADLLMLCKDVINGNNLYNSVLFQMKKLSVSREFYTPENMVQLRLYSEWPKFRIKTKSSLGRRYNIRPKKAQSNAQYLFVRNEPPHFTVALPDCRMKTMEKTFIDFFCNFLSWPYIGEMDKNCGYGRIILGPPNDDSPPWDKFVWELVTITAGSFFNLKQAGIHSENRVSEFFNDLWDTQNCCELQSVDCQEGVNIIAIDKSKRR